MLRASSFVGALAIWTTAVAIAQGPSTPVSEPVPVVVAVDTSRSLSAGELAAVLERLQGFLARLPDATPVGLVAFDDEPRWVRELGTPPTEVAAALAELAPRGDFTLLNDALFVATRALEEGGVILLATDGRDENSATTTEDIARRCEAQGVRILSLGTGQVIAERALRRLALLSGGSYLGDAAVIGDTEIAGAVAEARSSLVMERRAANRRTGDVANVAATKDSKASVSPPGEEPASKPPADTAATSSGFVGWLLPLLLAIVLLLVVAALILVLARRSRPAAAAQSDEDEDDEVLDLHQRLQHRPVAPPVEAEEVSVDTAEVDRSLLENRLDKTRVLSQESVIWVRMPGKPPRSFMLSQEKAFAIGRDPEHNTLSLPDTALSGRHFKIVGDEGQYVILDLHSTNGTLVNGRKIFAHRLRPGDVIHAGEVEFEVKRAVSPAPVPSANPRRGVETETRPG